MSIFSAATAWKWAQVAAALGSGCCLEKQKTCQVMRIYLVSPVLLQISDVTCEVGPQRPLLSSATTPWLLYQLFSSPGISVVPAMASCLPAEILWEGQDSKDPSTSAGSHLPCLSLGSPFFTSFMPSHIPPVETSFLPPSLLPPEHHSLLSALFSPVTPHILWGPASLLAQHSLRTASFSPPTKNSNGSSTPVLPFLLPPGEWGPGTGCWDHRHRCISGQRCCCLLTVGASGMYQVPPCGDTENGLLHKARGGISKPPSLPYIGFCPLYFPSRALERSCWAGAGWP